MKQRILSVALALCLCISSQSVAYAEQGEPSPQEEVVAEESTSDSTIPTPTEVYNAMIALQNQDPYKEGATWTNTEPYPNSAGEDYHWKGGTLNGSNISAVGCVAFAFILSDAAFGNLPARMYAPGEFTFEDIKPGDILRVSNDAHTVIVLEVSDAGVIVAEGNISTGDHKGKVHWGRAISEKEVMNNTSHYITRYPEDYTAPDDPSANDIIADGTFDGGLAWNLTKAGTLTFSGNGAIPDFSSAAEQPWNDKSSNIRKVVMEDGVTSIGSCAFWNCGLLSAKIPSSVTTIGTNAFYGSSIISVDIPSSVTTIGDSAFRSCTNLSSVTVSEGLETIGQNAFRSCTNLTSIALPASIGEVGAGAFFQCTSMINATFTPGSRQVTLGDNVFTECYDLMSVTLPQNINCIGEGMFQNCLMLAKVEIPQGVESIKTWAFASCSRLTTVIIPDSVTAIGTAAFASSALTDIYFTGTETQWNSISKPSDVATSLSQVTIHYNYSPDTTPGPDTDDGNNNGGGSGTGGDSGTGDNSGTGGDSGNDNNSGTGDDSGNDNNSGTGDDSGDDNNSGTDDDSGTGGSQTPLAKGKTFTVNKVTYKVTKAGQEVALTKSKSTATKVTIHTVTGTDGVKYKVTSIGSKAMQNNKKMTNLTIGSNVKTIGVNAFSGCTKLTTVTFGKNVTTIGASAFKGCTALKKTLTLPDSVKTIGANAFSGCSKMTTVTIGKTSKSCLTTIGKNAFSGCRKLGKITIRSTKLRSVGKQAFNGTASNMKVKVPSRQFTKYKKYLKQAGLKVTQVTK